jgi:hypothetical protein
LLDEKTYRTRISDRGFFADKAGQPDLGFWALHDQFSFATAAEYLSAFSRFFDMKLVVVKCSPEAMNYRSAYPETWSTLQSAGISECDLLIKGLVVLLRKRVS